MNKKFIIPLIVLVLVLCAGVVWLFLSLQEQKQANQEMQELVEMDKQEMEAEYTRFALQYDEMKTQISNDSIVAQLVQEQEKTQQLLEELKRVKATDAREITRLKKELETVRAVLRDYVIQIDSLNRLNESLMEENSRVNAELEQRTAQVAGLSNEKASLSEKVAIAAQLDAGPLRQRREGDDPIRQIEEPLILPGNPTVFVHQDAEHAQRHPAQRDERGIVTQQADPLLSDGSQFFPILIIPAIRRPSQGDVPVRHILFPPPLVFPAALD